MFKKILALVLATMMVLGGMVTVSAAEETAAAEEVVYDYTAAAEDLAALGILKGDGIDFALENGVTRWQMALFIARIMTGETNDQYWNKVSDNTTPYSDVVNYFGAISFADENGIIKGKGWIPGVGDNCFDPNGAITYQDAITMAVRALGSKQLAYPNGFLAVGEELGLMEGLEPLAQDAALTRGQMIQILKNMLYVKVDGAASFAQQNFGLEEKVYVVVATELQYLVGADRVYRVDYEGAAANEQTKYVALAPLNADGTYDLNNIIHLTEAELGLAQRESETKLGYSYTIYTYNNYAGVYNVVANATKTVKNYGDEGKAIVAGTKYMNVTDNIVKIDGTTYKLVKEFTDLNNKATYTNKQPELIVHSMYKGATDTTASYYIYDSAFNILNPETGKVALMYNHWTNTYYVEVFATDGTTSLGYRVATEEDFADVAVGTNLSVQQYGITTTASDLTTVSFSEITLIDDNNDGNWDRAIYIPYSVGKYEASNETGAWRFDQSKAYTDSTKKYIVEVNDVDLKAWATNTSGDWGTSPRASKVQQSEMFFLGEGRPASGEYVVYYYNPYSRTMTVVENLGKPVAGTVQNMTQGTYAWNSGTSTYIYNNATVTIDGETYKLGYRWNETAVTPYGGSKVYDLKTIDEYLSSYGYSETIYASLVGNTYKKMSYLVLAGRVIKVGDAGNDCGWMAFDYGTYNKVNGLAYTSYEYEGDIVGVDAEGNILVKAYVDKTGEQQIVKIGAINGFSYGLLVEDYAALQFQFSGIGSLGNNAMETMKKAVIADFFKTLTADVDDPNTKDDPKTEVVENVERQYLFIVTGISEDGVYEIYTDHELYWGNNGVSYRQPSYMKQTANISFINGISTKVVWTNASTSTQYAVVTDEESKLVVIGKNGMKTYTGVLDGTLDFHYVPATETTAAVRPVYAYSISNDFILVASADVNCEDIWYGDWDTTNTTSGYNYYMVLGRNSAEYLDNETAVTAAYDATTGKIVYTYTGLYNISTGATETVTVVGGLDEYNSANAIYGGYFYNTPKPIGAIYAEKNGEWTMLTDEEKLIPIATIGTTSITTAKYATDSKAVLEDLLYGGLVKDGKAYAPVYDSAATLSGDTPSNNVLLVSGDNDFYDAAVTFAYDVLIYTENAAIKNVCDDGYYRIELVNDAKSSANDGGKYNGAMYYDYVAGKSFVATVIKGAAINDYTPSTPTTTLAGAKSDAIKTLSAAAGAYAADELAVAKAAINGSLTIAEVNAMLAKHLPIVTAAAAADKADADKNAAATALTEAVKAAQAALDAAYNDRADVAAAKATYDRLTAELAGADITVARADVIKANGPAQITAAIAAADKAAADAEAAKEGVVAVANGETGSVITIQNVSNQTFSGVKIYNVAENGTATLWATVDANALTLGWGPASTGSSAKVTWTRTGDNGVLTIAYVDDFGTVTPVLTTGNTYKFITTGAEFASEAIICG